MIKRCKQCGADISAKHKNASFCSNAGEGNCKDKYHNTSSMSRCLRSPKLSDVDKQIIQDEAAMAGAGGIFSSGYFGHGQD